MQAELQKKRLLVAERSVEQEVLQKEKDFQEALQEAIAAANMVQSKSSSSEAVKAAVQSAADTANEKMLAAAKQLAEQEGVLKQQQQLTVTVLSEDEKAAMEAGQARRDEAHRQREATVLQNLPVGGAAWMKQFDVVEKVKLEPNDARHKAADMMEDGPEKANTMMQVLSDKETLITSLVGAAETMEDGPAKQKIVWRLESQLEAVYGEMHVTLLGVADEAQQQAQREELASKEAALLAKQETAVEAMEDGEEKEMQTSRLMLKRRTLFPNEPLAEEKRQAEEKRRKEEELRAQEEAERNAANAAAEAAKQREKEIEAELEQQQAVIAALQQGNTKKAERMMGDAAKEDLRTEGDELEEALAKLDELNAEEEEAKRAVEEAERKKREVVDTKFIKESSHRDRDEDEEEQVSRYIGRSEGFAVLIACVASKQIMIYIDALVLPLMCLPHVRAPPISMTHALCASIPQQQRLQFAAMPESERKAVLYNYYLNYQKHWHDVVHVPRDHDVCICIYICIRLQN